MISSLPGKALRMLVDIEGLAEQFNMHYQSYAETIQLILEKSPRKRGNIS